MASSSNSVSIPIPPKDEVEWPDRIKMSGLPLALSGYNEIFYKSSTLVNGAPTYVLKPYTLYFFISIIGCRIYKHARGQWMLAHYDPDIDLKGEAMLGKCLDSEQRQDTPFGRWTQGGLVRRLHD